MLNRCGHGIAYSQIEEINTALCLQKMALTPDNEVPLPENIQAYLNTTLAWDNIDRLEESLRKRNIDPSAISVVPPYNVGDHCGPRARTFVEVTTASSCKREAESQ